MDEFSLIKRITQRNYIQSNVIKGIGDDAAVVRITQADTVVAVDTFVENIHFTLDTYTPEQIGYRLLAVNLSDMAAMGAEPKFYLVSIVIPDGLSEEFIIAIFNGMKQLAQKYNVDLIGGDTVSGRELTISVTIIGSVQKEKVRLRSAAQHGDVVFVTGTLGDSRAGLELLLQKANINDENKHINYLIRRHKRPEPRIEFAQALRRIHRLALNDISDGIANELREIATSSNVTIEVMDDTIPISESLKNIFLPEQIDVFKYFGGEDFELVGVVGKNDFPFVKKVAKQLGINVTEIGFVSYNRGRNKKVFVNKNGKVTELQKKGYVHRSREKNDNINDG